MQINFGVILNESLADAVKITVIATGFQPENAPLPERRGSVIPGNPRAAAPAGTRAGARTAKSPPPPAPEPEPAPALIAEPEPVLDLDDLDTPAYLRQGRC